jgi:hypothetical protein
VLPVVGYIIIVFILFSPILIPPANFILFGDDFIHLQYYYRIFIRDSLAHWQLPLWSPYLYGGMPFMEHPQVSFWYPVNILYLILPMSVAFPIHLALHICIAMITMYWLMRHWVDRLPAWFSGLAFGLSTFFWYRIPAGHSDVIAAAAWSPLVFGLCMRVSAIGSHFQKKRDVPLIIVAGIAIGIQLLSGYKTMAVLTAEAVGAVVIFSLIKQRSLRPLLYTAVAGIIGASIASVELLGNWMYMKQSLFSLNFPYSWSSVGTPTIGHLLEIIDPVAYALRNPNSVYLIHERAAYVGSVSLVLAVIAIIHAFVSRRRLSEFWVFVLMCVFGLWIGFAYSMPVDLFHLLKTILPWYQGLRVPMRHFMWFVFGAAALAGFGLERFKSVILRVLLIAVLLYQLIPLAQSQLYLVPAANTYEDSDLITYLQEQGLNRFVTTINNSQSLKYLIDINAPNEHHLYSPYGYIPPPLTNYVEFVLAVNHLLRSDTYQYFDLPLPFENFSSRYTDAFNVKYVLVPVAADPFSTDLSGRFILAKENLTVGWRLYENTQVFSRFYMVPKSEVLANREAVYGAIQEERVDPAQTVLFTRTGMNGNIPDGTCQKSDFSDVEVLSYGATDIKLRTHNQCAGFLTSSELYYPGWNAYIDGKKTVIWEGNLAFRTIYVPSGTHIITYRYIPFIVFAGMALSTITIIFCAALLWRSQKKDS